MTLAALITAAVEEHGFPSPLTTLLPGAAGILAFMAGKWLDSWKERSTEQATEIATFYARQGQLLETCEKDRTSLQTQLADERTAHSMTKIALAECQSSLRVCQLRRPGEVTDHG